MTIEEITKRINGRVICCKESISTQIDHAFSSDLMSDVLTLENENMVLITGLANIQVIRTSEMSDINCVIFGRNKKIGEDIIALAEENNIVLITSPYTIFHISGELYKAGIKPVY